MSLTAIYDGHCVICNTTRRVVKALDWRGQVTFLDLQNWADVQARYPELEYDVAMGQIHVVDTRGKMFPGFDGTRRMLRALPLGLPVYAVLRLPVIGDWLGPRMYRFIAKNRYAINRMLGVDLAAENADGGDCVDGVCKLPQ